MKKFPISIFCGICAMLITIILYFVILGNAFLEIICFITLFGVILSEGVTTAYAYFANTNPRKIAAVIISSLMIPISLALSFIYIVNFPNGYIKYLGFYFVFFIIINSIAAIIFRFDTKRSIENNELQSAKQNMLNMRKVVKYILTDQASEVYKKELNEIEEKLHFSVDNIILADDTKINNMLIELQNNIANPEFDASTLIADISKAIDLRNIMVKRNV